MVENVRDGTVSSLFGTEKFTKFSNKQQVIRDLLDDLHTLHNIRMKGVSFTSVGGPQLNVGDYSAFHLDIKNENTLVNGLRTELSDFGCSAANATVFVESIGYTSPEYVQFYKTVRPFGIQIPRPLENAMEIIQFNIEYGLGRDIWSLGLVILSVLVGREERARWINRFKGKNMQAFIAPLSCLKKCLENDWAHGYQEENILNLKQETLDKEIDSLNQEVIRMHPEDKALVDQHFQLVKHMLKIDPKERSNIRELLNLLQTGRFEIPVVDARQ